MEPFIILFLIISGTSALLPIPAPGTKCTDQITFNVQDSGLAAFPKKVEVFGIPILAAQGFFEASEGGRNKLQHVASVLAELIDNDNDGCPDDPNVLAKLLEPCSNPICSQIAPNQDLKKAISLPYRMDDPYDANSVINAGYITPVGVGEDETHPICSGLNMTGNCRDSALEEVLHLVTEQGHALAHKKVFGNKWKPKSKLTKAMDKARGKRMKKTPDSVSKYPKKAWFTFADASCDYSCNADEYVFWGYVAYTGAGNGLADVPKFNEEFKLLKKKDFMKKDKRLKKLFDKSKSGKSSYRFPTEIVDGIYTGCPVCSGGTSSGGSTSPGPNPGPTTGGPNPNPTGEEACEGHGFSKTDCKALGCCNWANKQCWSAVGNGLCF